MNILFVLVSSKILAADKMELRSHFFILLQECFYTKSDVYYLKIEGR